jgi:hypothetical protein
MSDRGTGPGFTTVVFVDVEASTKLLERVGDDAARAAGGEVLVSDVVRQLVLTEICPRTLPTGRRRRSGR